MIEIEYTEVPEWAQNVETSAKSSDVEGTSTKEKTPAQSKHDTGKVLMNGQNSRKLKVGDIFYGAVKFNNSNGKQTSMMGIFQVTGSQVKGKKKQSREFKLLTVSGDTITACSGAIKIHNIQKEQKRKQIQEKSDNTFTSPEEAAAEQQKKEEEIKEQAAHEAQMFNFNELEPEDKIKTLIKSGMNNIWLVGPAGCGKSTIVRNIANELEIPYLCISCGIGTSATEFTGYKYPTREATKFAEFYAKKSIILIDEMTALDPSVAQVINAALANGEIETTTGTVMRHSECIIVATSNTFGNGADRQYVANNQLDASTIDRFVGAIVEVDYSTKYESQFDEEIVSYVQSLRKIIKNNSLRRIASTRMIQSACKMKEVNIRDWRDMCIINWTDTEKKIVKSAMPYEVNLPIKEFNNLVKLSKAA